MKSENTRRQFLRNLGIASVGIGFIPKLSFAQTSNAEACDPTTLDYYGEGPFYIENAPEIFNNLLASESEPGERLVLTGRAYDLDCETPLANVEIDIWHADDAGDYDNSFDLRGKTYTNAQGYYSFETILPGKYLNGNKYRPSHIHLKIVPPGKADITTQLYFEGDSDIPGDAAASITSGTYDASDRIIPLTASNGKMEGVWDVNIAGDGIGLHENLHLEKGMIYSVGPNPFTDKLNIEYGVFKSAKVTIEILDMQGRLVAVLDQQNLTPQKYKATWQPDNSLEKGMYFIALKTNDIQVHYLKVMKI
jgi:protocatechuate 3,4-dioxygenase beta subunit